VRMNSGTWQASPPGGTWSSGSWRKANSGPKNSLNPHGKTLRESRPLLKSWGHRTAAHFEFSCRLPRAAGAPGGLRRGVLHHHRVNHAECTNQPEEKMLD
jgi:hypothetical protein